MLAVGEHSSNEFIGATRRRSCASTPVSRCRSFLTGTSNEGRILSAEAGSWTNCFSSGFALLEPRGMTLLNQRPTLGLSKALQASSLSSNNCSMWFVLAQKAQLVNGLRSLGTGLLAAQPSQFWHRRDHFRLSKQMHVLLRTINQSNTRSKRTAQDVLPEDDISCAEWKKGCRCRKQTHGCKWLLLFGSSGKTSPLASLASG
eukprot:s6622_g1.t1